jgi:NAD(P)H-hydrate repair Nnr-like enzyme with NAD(P)H-hydrate dehydratase domain
MPNFLVESYLPHATDALEEASQHARRAAQFAASGGLGVRYIRTTLLETDETCFHVFDADSIEVLELALAGAQLEVDRIVRADETSAADAAPTEATSALTKGATT